MDTIQGLSIGGCRVEREIGRGGMGVVYLARDEKLDRPVAIKALPEEVGRDEARSARLAREAKALATLTHQNIAAIYGLAEHERRLYMLLEYVDGPTLGERLGHGPLALDEALSVCAQIAAGVEAAHEAGIIHRDLKPHNVKATGDGKVKVLDFGLAKPAREMQATPDAVTVRAPAGPRTAEGMVVGTPAYMSPEQARGRAVDRRTDIWSLGCILYECLSGFSPFGGPTDSDSIAAVLEREPDWSKLPAKTPYRVRELVRRCLQKDAGSRLRDIGDARLELETAIAGREWSTTAIAAAAGGGPRKGARAALVGGAVLVLVAGGWAVGRGWPKHAAAADGGVGEAAPVNRLALPIGGPMRVSEHFAISPDGRTVAFVGTPTYGDPIQPQVYVRRMDAYLPTAILGTQGASELAFSPDGKWIVFTAAPTENSTRTLLMKVQVSGGAAVTLCEQADGKLRLPLWVQPGLVAFVAGAAGMQVSSVSGDGGATRVLWDGTSAGQRPQSMCVAPGGRWLLVTTTVADAEGQRQAIVRVPLDTGESKLVLDNAGFATAGPGGVVLYAQAGVMLARPFDAARGEFAGAATPVLSGLRAGRSESASLWGVSERGDLVYAQGGRGSLNRRLALVDFQGRADPMGRVTGEFDGPASFSVDGLRVSGTALTDAGGREPFMCNTRQDAIRRLTVPGSDTTTPVWGADGHRIFFCAQAKGAAARVLARHVDAQPEPEVIARERNLTTTLTPESASKDGKWLVCRQEDRRAQTCRLVAVAIEGTHEQRALVERSGRQQSGSISPDGKWLLYESDETGRPEVYVQPSPLADGASAGSDFRVIISKRGGMRPAWSRDGATIFFFEGRDSVMAAEFSPGPPPAASAPRELFHWEALDAASDSLTLSPDGKHFLIVQRTEEESRIRQLQFIQNWGQELKARLSATGAPGAPRSDQQ